MKRRINIRIVRLCRSAYDVLMRSGFLSFVSEIDIHSMASNESSARQRKDLDEKLTSLDGQLHVLKSDQERTYQLYLRQGAAATFVSEKLGELAVKIAEVETQIVHRSEQRQALAEQIDAALGYVAKTRYPHRNRVIFLLSVKGFRAKEIASLTWDMVTASDGKIGNSIRLQDVAK
ncbi:MAG: hypothetical protein ABWY82_25020 [Tardiphaga sp.]